MRDRELTTEGILATVARAAAAHGVVIDAGAVGRDLEETKVEAARAAERRLEAEALARNAARDPDPELPSSMIPRGPTGSPKDPRRPSRNPGTPPPAAQRWADRERALGKAHPCPAWFPREAFGIARSIMLDVSGARARAALAGLPGDLAKKIERAALGVELGPDGAELGPRLGWGDARARLHVAFYCVLRRIAIPSRRRGAKVATGFSRNLLASLFLNPQTGQGYSAGNLFNTIAHADGARSSSRGRRGGALGDWRTGNCGIVVALAEVGALTYWQPPSDAVPSFCLGPNGWAYNQYVLRSVDRADAAELADVVDALRAALASPAPTGPP
jgi:hypothetical protein